jgi:phage gp36-like protein
VRAIKQPSESVTFAYDFTADLATGVTIATGSTPNVSSTPRNNTAANLAEDGSPTISPDGLSVLVRWTGGDPDEVYLTKCVIEDSDGNVFERDGEIEVRETGFALPTGIASRYLTAEEYVDRYGVTETIRLTDEDRRGVVDGPKLEAAIGDATDTADAYIGTRYTTPLLGVPRIVKSIVASLARENLHKTKPTPEVKDRAELARQQLRDIAAGRMTLPVDQGAEEPVLGGNRIAETSGDASTTFRDAVAGFDISGDAYAPNWRR